MLRCTRPGSGWNWATSILSTAAARASSASTRQWADNWAEPQELIDLGDRLVLLGEIYARGTASGIEVGRRYAMLWHISAGKITREQVFNDPAEALEAVGLPDEG
jgi:ketosteroid isomerase-like protein